MSDRLWRQLALSCTALVAGSANADDLALTEDFRAAVTVAGITEHLDAFQSIADANADNRAAGTMGYDDSAQYVFDRATAAGLQVSFQEFAYLFADEPSPPTFEQLTPVAVTFNEAIDFLTVGYSGSGSVVGAVTAVDLQIPSTGDSTSGCEAPDFAGFPPASIALLQRGGCDFSVKVANAEAAGAIGVVLFNRGDAGNTGIFAATLAPSQAGVPVVSTTYAIGVQLSNGVLSGATGSTAHIEVDFVVENRMTRNVIAETPGGDPEHVVVVGANLDSDPDSPGINTNGSGSAVLLEIAETLAAENPELRRKVRFIWFSAHGGGLLGAQEYVNSLSAADRGAIRFMISVDSVGSPNFLRFVYDGDNSDFPMLQAPPGSALLERSFLDYFECVGSAVEPTPLDGRSDYQPFLLAGIPVGGVFGGAEQIKTPEQAAEYGGTAGEQYDPCYLLACDTSANVSGDALDQFSDAVAHVLFLLAAEIDRPAPAPTLSMMSLCVALGILMVLSYRRLRWRGVVPATPSSTSAISTGR